SHTSTNTAAPRQTTETVQNAAHWGSPNATASGVTVATRPATASSDQGGRTTISTETASACNAVSQLVPMTGRAPRITTAMAVRVHPAPAGREPRAAYQTCRTCRGRQPAAAP